MFRARLLPLITLWFYFAPFLAKGQPYYFKHFETDDGLINNSVNVITQDKNGFIWIGTRGGLTRFDGYLFKSINNHNSERGNLWNNFITSIAQDSKGLIWIGTGRGIFSYNPLNEILTPLSAGPQVYINGFVIDDRDNLWLLGQNRLYLYSQANSKLQDLKIHVSRIARHSDGNLLLGNYDGVLFRCDTRTKVITRTRVIDRSVAPNLRAITKIHSINNDVAFIGYKKGLMTYNLKTGETNIVPLKSETDLGVLVRDICHSKGQEYWIATENGLYIYDLKKASLLRLTKRQGDPYAISDNSIYALFKDKHGDMWVGTYFGGLNYHSKQNARFEKFYPIPLKNSLSGNAVSEVWDDRQRYLYVGTEDAGLNRLDKKTNEIGRYKLSLS
ncbi:MAG: histidine kinase, partial [Chitinophagaceae bacterium]